MNPPPLNPPPVSRKNSTNWINRNWPWFVPLVILVMVGFIGGLLFLISAVMHSSDVYTGTIARAKANPAVTAALGSPLSEGFFLMGTIEEQNSSGYAHLSIPLHGPKAKATIYVDATRSRGEWTFDTMILMVTGTKQQIDLLATNQISPTNIPAGLPQ